MSDMQVLWWFVGTVLVVLSSVLLAAGLRGKEGTVRIGRISPAEVDEVSNAQNRPVHASNVAVGIAGILVGIAAVLLFAL
jgi:hypothetical protein